MDNDQTCANDNLANTNDIASTPPLGLTASVEFAAMVGDETLVVKEGSYLATTRYVPAREEDACHV